MGILDLLSNDPVSRPTASQVMSRCHCNIATGSCPIPSPLTGSTPSVCAPQKLSDLLEDIENDCSVDSTASHLDTLRGVLNDHRAIINRIDLPQRARGSNRADDIVLEAASAIDRLVFEVKSLRRELQGISSGI